MCLPSTAPELQRQFDPITRDSTGRPEPKNRYLAVTAGDAGQQQTIRISWDAMPNWPGGHSALIGQKKWLLAPFTVCQDAGTGPRLPVLCGPSPGQPQTWFWAARLTCDPNLAHFEDLSKLTDYCSISGEACTLGGDPCTQGTCGVDGAIHIIDQGIVPSKNANQQAIYSVQVIEKGCLISAEDNFSEALVATQPNWGDIGADTGCPMPPLNGVADLVPDVTFALSKFANLFCAPKKTRVDVEPAELDMRVNISDVLKLLNAFASGSADYNFEAGPVCPD